MVNTAGFSFLFEWADISIACRKVGRTQLNFLNPAIIKFLPWNEIITFSLKKNSRLPDQRGDGIAPKGLHFNTFTQFRAKLPFLVKSYTFAPPFKKGSSLNAGVVKLADIPDLGSGAARHGGSSPSARTFFLSKQNYYDDYSRESWQFVVEG